MAGFTGMCRYASVSRMRAVIPVLLALLSLPTAAATYRLSDYGFRFRMPGQYQVARAGTADHGFAFFLDHWTKTPQFETDSRPFVSAFASYVVEERNLADLRREYCDGPALLSPQLAFPSARSTSCAVASKSGWRDIWVFAFGAEPGSKAGEAVIAYHMRLHTNRARLVRDMAVFQSAIRSVRIAAPL